MFVKSSGNIVLVLTAVVIFPSMLYLTRQAPVDVGGRAEQVGIKNRSGIRQIPGRKNRQAIPSRRGSARVMSSDFAGRSDVSANSETINKSALPRQENVYLRDKEASQEAEIYTQSSTASAVESLPGNTATVNYYTVSNSAVVAQERMPAAVVSSAATGAIQNTDRQAGSSRVTGIGPNNAASIGNSIRPPLYTAEIQQPRNSKLKCPPVYISVNAYARNMRAAMGCDSP